MKNIIYTLLAVFLISTFPVEVFSYQLDSESLRILKARRKKDKRRLARKSRRIAKRKKRVRRMKRPKDSSFEKGGAGERAYGALGEQAVDLLYRNDLSISAGYISDDRSSKETAQNGSETDKNGIRSSTVIAEIVYHYYLTPKLLLGPTVSYSSISTETEQTPGGATIDKVVTEWLMGVEAAYNFYDANRKDFIPYVALRVAMGSRTETTNETDGSGEITYPSRDLNELPRVRAGMKYKLYGGNAFFNVDVFYALKSGSETQEDTQAVTDFEHTVMGANLGVGMFF